VKRVVHSLQAIGSHLGAEVVWGEAYTGDITLDPCSLAVDGINTLDAATATQISFLANKTYRKQLTSTEALAVIVSPDDVELCPGAAVVMQNPYMGYAQLSTWFATAPVPVKGVCATAVVHASAQVDASASVGPNAVIEAGVIIKADAVIGAGSVVGEHSVIGEGSKLCSNVTVYHGVYVGAHCLIQSGAVLGSDGFGYANDQGRWEKIEQIGGVVIGDNVEIGACTTIDRGALNDTCIGNGVILDNNVQIAHNVVIGDYTAMAGCSAVAGSTRIGEHCTIAGAVGITGHLEITDNVHVTAMSLVTSSIKKPGVYSGSAPLSPNSLWRKNAVRYRQLDTMARRIKQLEQQVGEFTDGDK